MWKPSWKSVAIAGSVGAVIVGAGATALAATGPSGASAPARGALGKALGRGVHGTFVTRDPNNAGSFVQHDAIRGEVTDVSATSITVKAADGVSMTFVIDASTKVKVRGGSSIADVHDNDRVAVAGTGTSTLTAKHIIDVGAPKAAATS